MIPHCMVREIQRGATIGLVLAHLALWLVGCAAEVFPRVDTAVTMEAKLAEVKADVGDLNVGMRDLSLDVGEGVAGIREDIRQQAGRDTIVNDWKALAIVPFCFVLYTVANRLPWFRKFKHGRYYSGE